MGFDPFSGDSWESLWKDDVRPAVFPGYDQAKMMEEQLRKEEQRQAEQEARIASNIARIRSMFGMGDDETAQSAGQTLARTINEYYRNTLRQNLSSVDNAYGQARRRSRQNLARVGQLGGGLDAASQSGSLADYLRERQRAISRSEGARDQLRGNLTNQRLSLERQVSTGDMADPDFSSIASQRDAALAQAQSAIPSMAIGNAFKVAGNTYTSGRMAEGYGNRGLKIFGLNDSNSGSIT